MADLVLYAHFIYVAFVIGGFVIIWIGFLMNWMWVRNVWFRAIHLIAMGIVLIESLLGVVCPLTALEYQLRKQPHNQVSFVSYWVQRLMYYDWPESTFAIMYAVFTLGIAATWFIVKPARRKSHSIDVRP